MFGSFLGRTGSASPNHTDSPHPIPTNGNSHNASADMMFAYHGHRMALYTMYSAPNHFLRKWAKAKLCTKQVMEGGEEGKAMEESSSYFHLGRASAPRRRRNRIRFIQQIPTENTPQISIEEQTTTATPIHNHYLHSFLITPNTTITEWHTRIADLERKVPTSGFLSAMYTPAVIQSLKDRFYTHQRERWLARWTLNRWSQRVWKKRTQCNIDLIEMEPIADKDAVFLTDTKHRYIFRFHRRDLYKNLISNLYHCDEMMPYPRPPTNPWTNSLLTLAQTIAICQQLIADFAKRGKCPPVLLAAFCESRYDMERFRHDHPSLLSQYAIRDYYKDLSENNRDTVEDTIFQLLYNSLPYSFNRTVALRNWLRETPITPIHAEWLQMVCDYTLYTNLHLQVRSDWHDTDYIYRDVRELYSRTELPEISTPRLRLLQNAGSAEASSVMQTMMNSFLSSHSILPSVTTLHTPILQSILFPNTTTTDEGMDENTRETLRLIQNTLFRR
jgi:hypothetical protein